MHLIYQNPNFFVKEEKNLESDFMYIYQTCLKESSNLTETPWS